MNSSSLAPGDWLTILRVIRAAEGPSAGNARFGEALTPNDWAPDPLQSTRRPLGIDQWMQQARANPSEPTPMMAFGYSLAMDGDTMVVGAYWHHNPVIGGGAAYVFVKPEAGWPAVTQVARLTASDSAFHDRFGWSVAISGNTVVVGTPLDDSTGLSDHGSVYVFVKPGGGWTDMTETAKLTASDGVAGDLFGNSIAISGNTIVAGAYGHDNGHGIGSGTAYVFNQSGGWTSGTETARLNASDSADHEYFGWSAAIDGDLVVIGAPGEVSFDKSGEDSAYVFLKPSGGWSGNRTETAILTASDGAIADDFGNSVAASGDLVDVGALTNDVGDQVDQGSAYVFSKPASGWASMTETDKLVASDGTNSDEFGTDVSISGSTILIGAPNDDITESKDDTGSAYIFDPQSIPMEYIYLPLAIR